MLTQTLRSVRRPDRRTWLLSAALAVIAFATFAPAIRFGFVNFDDSDYVYANKHVIDGLTSANVYWAFVTGDPYWVPLTYVSFQLDATIFGVDARGFHFTNVLLHAVGAALAFLALRALTRSDWPSAVAALLFAVHPLRVESVAWVTERKDVLSGFFGLLTLWAYGRYAGAPSLRRYWPVAIATALSMAAKPMMVTLPCLLLVLDWWPLRRVDRMRDWSRLVAEKLPLFAISAAVAVATYVAQVAAGATRDASVFPLGMRAENAAVSLVAYLYKMVWPVNLAVFYPHPGPSLTAAQVGSATAFLVAVTALGVALRRRAPYVLAGWLWYVGTLMPVIGLVQSGAQAMADRYTYFSHLGILVIICWGVADLAARRQRIALAAAAVVAVLSIAVTQQQLTYWSSSVRLWEHALDVSGDFAEALIGEGRALQDEERWNDALAAYEKALRLAPNSFLGNSCLGSLLIRLGRDDEAVPHLLKACSVRPDYASAHGQLGTIYQKQGKMVDAVNEFTEYCRLVPNSAPILTRLGFIYLQHDALQNADHSAAACFRKAIASDPCYASAHRGLGLVLIRMGKGEEGLLHLREAVRHDPSSASAHGLLGMALANFGDFAGAGDELAVALRLDPSTAEIWLNLGRIRHKQGRLAEAEECRQRAIQLDPGYASRAGRRPPR